MAKKKSSLGKGLDSLIPDIYNKNFDEDSPKSLEEILNEKKEETSKKEIVIEETPKKEKPKEETPKKEVKKKKSKPVKKTKKIKVEKSTIEEVEEMVEKNPRITLWSSQSAAVFRYLRKTEPEFSISKEASKLIDEAVSKKYPEIWKLFDN